MIIKNCFGVARSYPFFVDIRISATPLFQRLG